MDPTPIKPSSDATIFQGTYDEGVLAFIGTPIKTARRALETCDNLECMNHVVAGTHIIHKGDEIVVVKWPVRAVRNAAREQVYGFEVFCSVTCQRNRAVKLKAGRRRNR